MAFFLFLFICCESKRVQVPVVVAGSGLTADPSGLADSMDALSLYLFTGICIVPSLFNFELLIGPSTPFVTSFREGWL